MKERDDVRRAAIVEAAIRSWDGDDTRRRCRNCHNARVGGRPENPMVECVAGHGKPLELVRMIRAHGKGFRHASECPDFAAAFDGAVTPG